MKKGPKVFVGMSGGVDSSVSAALLKQAEYDVTGVFIKTWSPDWLPCTWREERRDAMRVAAKLKIPLLTLDLEKEYKEGVAEYMIEGYRRGEVPNPDVMCNKIIKFGGFFDFAMRQGADYVATGHYAQIRQEADPARKKPALLAPNHQGAVAIRTAFLLAGSRDSEKDQTYFLWMLGQKQLSHTLFPIGDFKKSEVRRLAKKFDLPVADKKDSQGLCFMGDIDVKDFLKHYIKEKKGDVLSEEGEVIGEHEGSTFYTIGERHGFKINKKTPDDTPYYVVKKDTAKNILVVSNKKSSGEIMKKEILIKDVNWNQGRAPDLSKKLEARIRYRQELQVCRLEEPEKGVYKVIFDADQPAPSSGQSVVFYSKNICLGGGVIL
ncbi:MAG: tRNA 2-thiouridine(34) synthase MnmA [bacterium]|nr:tRNA 2-thiouridine(34) synthase MnmA [bacterium]